MICSFVEIEDRIKRAGDAGDFHAWLEAVNDLERHPLKKEEPRAWNEPYPGPLSCNPSFLDLMILYRVYKFPEIESHMRQSIAANDFDTWVEASCELERETRKKWEASEACRTYLQCRERWKAEGKRPTIDEGIVIVRPLAEKVAATSRAREDAARTHARGWLAFPGIGGRDPEQLQFLVGNAPHSRVLRCALELIYESLRSEDAEVPPELTGWLENSKGRAIRPEPRPGAPKTQFRSLMIRKMVEALTCTHMYATRNDEPADEVRDSACDAVAKAMPSKRNMGKRTWSYEGIKRIWYSQGYGGPGRVSIRPSLRCKRNEDREQWFKRLFEARAGLGVRTLQWVLKNPKRNVLYVDRNMAACDFTGLEEGTDWYWADFDKSVPDTSTLFLARSIYQLNSVTLGQEPPTAVSVI